MATQQHGHELPLPSGRVITFRTPNGEDDRLVMRHVIADNPDTSADRLFSEQSLLLPQYVLLTDGGDPVDPDYKKRFDEWDVRDIGFYLSVYRHLTSLTEEDRKKAEEAAKSLRGSR